MFDLDIIEKDWKENSYSLSEEEIIEIYRSENVTLNNYHEQIEEYFDKTRLKIPAEERILAAIFGDDKEIIERENELRKEYKFPTKKYLSKDSQKKVVEGSLEIVFNSTRYWYEFFKEKISIERLYYVCLEGLMNSVKYMLHCEKPVFKLYVLKSIERNIIKHVAKWEHISYRDVYRIIKNHNQLYIYDDFVEKIKPYGHLKLNFNYDNNEELQKPSKIFYQIRNDSYEVDYTKDISSAEFMKEYSNILEKLDETAKLVMQLSFDINGNHGLTYAEIADYLGIEINKVANAKKRAIRTLKKDLKLKKYLF